MSEMSFDQMLEGSLKKIRTGEVVTGKVFDVKPDEIIVDIGYKSDGIITKNEYTNDSSADLTDLVHVGDPIEAKVVKVNDGEGQVMLSCRKLQGERGSQMLENAFENHEILTAKVSQIVSGGLSVMVDGVRVFIPISQISDSYEKDLEKYKDAEIEFELIEYNPKKRRVIGSRKQVLTERKEQMKKELFDRIEVGMTVEGTVKNVTDFGAFIDLGGADGLLHISEMSWGRVENPKKVYHAGDHVQAFIKDINGEKIALSVKFPETNPWLTAAEKYAPGNIVSGRVARMTDFGAFIELEPGIDALLHVSQIARTHVDKPSDILKIGQIIEAKVVDFNGDSKKISLSIKALDKDRKAAAPAPESELVYSDNTEASAQMADEIAEAAAQTPSEDESPAQAPAEEPAAEETPVEEAPAEEIPEEEPADEPAAEEACEEESADEIPAEN